MSQTILSKGNNTYSLDDIDIYCPSNLAYTNGKSLSELIFSPTNLIHIEQLISTDVTKIQRSQHQFTNDPYALASGIDDFSIGMNGDSQMREAITNRMTTVAVKHKFGNIRTNERNFRALVARVNKIFIKENLKTLVGDVLLSNDEVDTEFYRRGKALNNPFGDRAKIGNKTKEGYTQNSMDQSRTWQLVDRDFNNSTVIDSKVSQHKSFNVQLDRTYADSVYEKVANLSLIHI